MQAMVLYPRHWRHSLKPWILGMLFEMQSLLAGTVTQSLPFVEA